MASLQMRLSIRKCVILVAAFILLITLCFYALQSPRVNASRLEFLEHAKHALHSSGGFRESHNDGTGGWLTRWFATNSQAPFLGNIQTQASVPPRRPVYTYFDASVHHRGSEEYAILLAWVELFWALGFKPVVLTEKDAKKHGQYNAFRARGLVATSRQHNFSKWLAMAQRGGIFVEYRVSLPPFCLLLDLPYAIPRGFAILAPTNFQVRRTYYVRNDWRPGYPR
jgi:hypothetical protein